MATSIISPLLALWPTRPSVSPTDLMKCCFWKNGQHLNHPYIQRKGGTGLQETFGSSLTTRLTPQMYIKCPASQCARQVLQGGPIRVISLFLLKETQDWDKPRLCKNEESSGPGMGPVGVSTDEERNDPGGVWAPINCEAPGGPNHPPCQQAPTTGLLMLQPEKVSQWLPLRLLGLGVSFTSCFPEISKSLAILNKIPKTQHWLLPHQSNQSQCFFKDNKRHMLSSLSPRPGKEALSSCYLYSLCSRLCFPGPPSKSSAGKSYMGPVPAKRAMTRGCQPSKDICPASSL